MYSVQSSKSFLVGHRHVEIIGSSKERNKISNNISDRTYKQGQIWLVRRQDFHSFLNLWYGTHLRPGGIFSQIFGAENLNDVLSKLVITLGLECFRLLTNLVLWLCISRCTFTQGRNFPGGWWFKISFVGVVLLKPFDSDLVYGKINALKLKPCLRS